MSTKRDVPERVVELNMLGKGSRRGQNNWCNLIKRCIHQRSVVDQCIISLFSVPMPTCIP